VSGSDRVKTRKQGREPTEIESSCPYGNGIGIACVIHFLRWFTDHWKNMPVGRQLRLDRQWRRLV